MTTDHVFLSRSSENPSPYEKKELYLTCWLKYKVWKTTNLAFLFPLTRIDVILHESFSAFVCTLKYWLIAKTKIKRKKMKKSHTTLDDNDKVETKKKEVPITISAPAARKKKFQSWNLKEKKGTGLKKKLSCRNQETLFYIHCQSLLD